MCIGAMHSLMCGSAYAGRKKRRAARGRTDVGEQPYEDPNMQMVLHQPQDSFAQQFVQVCTALCVLLYTLGKLVNATARCSQPHAVAAFTATCNRLFGCCEAYVRACIIF